jgi:predicted enzyme related to lactoylglutathione lyase
MAMKPKNRGGCRFCSALAMALTVGVVGAAIPTQAAAPGQAIWVDLLTEDATTAIDFYRQLVGWEIEPYSSGNFVVSNDGVPIAGISEIKNADTEGEEAIWLVGIAVPDLADSVATARKLGAKIHRDVSRVEGFASFAIFEDPQGAAVMLLNPERSFEEPRTEGSWVWTELWTHDTAAASEFYGKVIGYERAEIDRSDDSYQLFQTQGRYRAGLVEIENKQVDPIWAPYLGVANVAATAAKAKGLGGRVLLAPDPKLGEGRVALLADPTGGAFFVYELEETTP